eukprot:Selendium_serpulae@DN1918_c0_g1_i1.p1
MTHFVSPPSGAVTLQKLKKRCTLSILVKLSVTHCHTPPASGLMPVAWLSVDREPAPHHTHRPPTDPPTARLARLVSSLRKEKSVFSRHQKTRGLSESLAASRSPCLAV